MGYDKKDIKDSNQQIFSLSAVFRDTRKKIERNKRFRKQYV